MVPGGGLEPSTPGSSGVSLTEAARCYLQAHPAHSGITVSEAATLFLQDKAGANLRPKSADTLRQLMSKLTRHLGPEPVHAITAQSLVCLLDTLNARGQTRINHRRVWNTFFAWCVASNYIPTNPVAAVSKPRVDASLPSIITPDQLCTLLTGAATTDPDLLPWLAIAAFAGLRTAELSRLLGSDVQTSHIHIGPHVSKTRGQRFVTIEPNLRAWLDAYPPARTIQRTNHRRRLEHLRTAINFGPWPPNALRHSYGTYHTILHGSAERTALEMGHHGTTTLFRHYKALATLPTAQAWFNILPTTS